LRNHTRLCKLNPNFLPAPKKSEAWYKSMNKQKSEAWYKSMNKRKGNGTNQYTKAKETGIPYILKESTRKKLGVSGTERVWTEEMRKKHSESMKKAVETNPESYTSSNRGRVKQITYDGIKFQGTWELEYYKWSISNNIKIERCEESFSYEWKGIRKYFPDFYHPDLDLYVEVKGYETDRDRAKWSQFPKKLSIIKEKDIKDIRKGCFVRL
jgi:hypothetical protein